jgi:lipoprotein-anchoring transpeptidase ErfK/SrfK
VARSSGTAARAALLVAAALVAAGCAGGRRAASPPPASAAPTDAVRLEGYPAFAATVVVPSVAVRAQPSASSRLVTNLPRVNENGAPQTFLVKSEQVDDTRHAWLRVLLPIRPNGSTGWVRAADVNVQGIPYALVVHVRSFRIDLLEDGARTASYPIGVGLQNTPTPTGEYYVKELIKPVDQNTVYGHYVFGLNGFSNVIKDWPQGGVIGIHGTNDPATIGRRVSHGCIRLRNADIETLARTLPLGTPVRVLDD